MRKIELKNFNCRGSYRLDFMSVVEKAVLRREGLHQRHHTNFLNDICKNLNENNKRSFVNGATKSLVIIDDKRQEIACVQDRSLITTGLIYEELLQVNRGKQDYEYERNKFFTDDNTGNASQFHSDDYLRVLDLCWYMQEQKANAIEISSNRENAVQENFFSERYKKAQTEIKDALVRKISEHITKYGDKFFELLNEATNNNIDFSKDIDADCVYESVAKFLDEGNSKWDYEYKFIVRYWNYRKELLENVSSDSDNTPIMTWKEFVVDAVEYDTAENIVADVGSMAIMSGMSEISDYLLQHFLTSSLGNGAEWKTVAKSEFKRNSDWELCNLNFYKSEALKLRRNLLEGTFDE